jgi:serine/threonine-protein kinase RsbW
MDLTFKQRQIDLGEKIPVFDFLGQLTIINIEKIDSLIHTFFQEANSLLVINFSSLSQYDEAGIGYFLARFISYLHPGHQIYFIDLKLPPEAKQFSQNDTGWRIEFFENEQAALQSIEQNGLQSHLAFFEIVFPGGQFHSGVAIPVSITAKNFQGSAIPSYTGPAHLMVDQGIVIPTLINEFHQGTWLGNIIISGQGSMALHVWDLPTRSISQEVVIESGAPAEFPLELFCPACNHPNKINRPDVYRCLNCNSINYVEASGAILTISRGTPEAGKRNRIFEFRIPSDMNYLNPIRNFIVGILSEEGIEENNIFQIEMSLDEALANIIEHAYVFDPYQEITLKIEIDGDNLRFTIFDRGRKFDQSNSPLPNLKQHRQERRQGGLGRYLITNLMDHVEYRQHGLVNELVLIKKMTRRQSD